MIAQSNSNIAVYVKIICTRGDGFNRRFEFLQNGQTEDIAGCTFKLTVIHMYDAFKRPILTINGIITLEDGHNYVNFSASPDTMQLPCGSFIYDIQQTYPGGDVRTRAMGSFIIHNDVTT